METSIVPTQIVLIVLCLTLIGLVLRTVVRIKKAQSDFSTFKETNSLHLDKMCVNIENSIKQQTEENTKKIAVWLHDHSEVQRVALANWQGALETRLVQLAQHVKAVGEVLQSDFSRIGDECLEKQKAQIQILETGSLTKIKAGLTDVNDGIKHLGEICVNLKSMVLAGNDEVVRKLGEATAANQNGVREILAKIDEPIDI